MLSDTLITIGRKANKANNASMASQIPAMKEAITNHIHESPTVIPECLNNIINYACKQLNKEGYTLYKPENLIG